MNLNYNSSPFPHVLIDNYFSEDEIGHIWYELDVVSYHAVAANKDNSATFLTGNPKKKNLGVFLPDLYKVQTVSSIFRFNRKIFNQDNANKIKSFHPVFGYFPVTTCDSTLIQFYKNGDCYKPHHDTCIYTLIVAFYKTPKLYSGGILKFADYEVDLNHNQAILFPSFVEHEVTEIVSNQDNLLDNRISISTFIGIERR
jgi:predicted 2-oxoglutarate/Fe(II)-dependent dioxygenase YbiX